ncbi:NERD domain-containing protein [Clostridium sp. AL.422]|uniref:NERD domain-containing protein n=1 Tax=Clostridium TaxID=1485 RepID=UPI00293DAC46|nr:MULTISPECIES: NERD domain-containing protein [unclassified Clostridium]MDV4150286.1 NERD domain-containing protein [Clostridium sp. AL.422]
MALFNKLDKPIFFKEESELKYYILKLNELYNKADGDLKSKIEKELKIANLGEIGESNIAFELKNSNTPMYVLHDINLEIDGLTAQIDYIVITRKATFIIECKNLIGNIEIDSQGNFIRIYKINGKYIKEGIYSPITQNQRHLEVLKRLVKESKSNIIMKRLFEKVFDENYKSIVVLANPKTVLNYKFAKKEVKDKVIRADQLIDFIKQTNVKISSLSLSDEELKSKAEKILSWHKNDKMSYINKYKSLLEEVNAYNSSIKSDSEIKVESNNINEEIIQKLKAFRLKKSREEGNKPYFIFSDKQMMDIIDKMPKNKTELKQVSGFGDIKVGKYGEDIIKIISKYN